MILCMYIIARVRMAGVPQRIQSNLVPIKYGTIQYLLSNVFLYSIVLL